MSNFFSLAQITDFGVSDVFRMCWEKKTHLSKGLCGSEPYIAPEQFEHKGEHSASQFSRREAKTDASPCRVRCTTSRHLGNCHRLLLHAVPGDPLADGQEPFGYLIRLIRTDVPAFIGSATAAQLDAERVSRHHQAHVGSRPETASINRGGIERSVGSVDRSLRGRQGQEWTQARGRTSL